MTPPSDDIWQLYSYTSEEQDAVPYLRKYMASFATSHDSTRATGVGFALAGLFLTYRACNHSGIIMTTNRHADSWNDVDGGLNWPIHGPRLAGFTELTGYSFSSQGEYIRMIRLFPRTLLYTFCLHRLLLRISRMKFPPRRINGDMVESNGS